MTYQAMKVAAGNSNIAGPWYVVAPTGRVVDDGLSEESARTLAREISMSIRSVIGVTDKVAGILKPTARRS